MMAAWQAAQWTKETAMTAWQAAQWTKEQTEEAIASLSR
jgi:hypothetical protein